MECAVVYSLCVRPWNNNDLDHDVNQSLSNLPLYSQECELSRVRLAGVRTDQSRILMTINDNTLQQDVLSLAVTCRVSRSLR